MNKKFVLMVLLGCSAAFFNSVYPGVKGRFSKLFGAAYAFIKKEELGQLRELLARNNTMFTDFECRCLLWIARNNNALCDVIYNANSRSILYEHNTKFYKYDSQPFLYMAVNEGNNQFVAWLLAHGAGDNGRIDARCPSTGKTALEEAFINKHHDCARLLVEHGARTDIPNNDGITVEERFSGVLELITGDARYSCVQPDCEPEFISDAPAAVSGSSDAERYVQSLFPQRFEDTLLPFAWYPTVEPIAKNFRGLVVCVRRNW